MSRNIDIVRGSNIRRDDLIAITELNKIAYGEELTAPLELVESIHNKNPDIGLIAIDNTLNKIIGYISAFPLSSEAFNRIIDPCFDESITADDVLEYDYSGIATKRYHLYIASIVVDQTYQKHGAFKKLYESFILFLLDLGKNHNILFDDIAARATPKGMKICQFLGMNHIGTSNNGEKIFHFKMLPPSFKVSSGKGIELIRFYADMYNKSQNL